jgi:small nuclear ribonucleoprotein (snRNP)-like protein
MFLNQNFFSLNFFLKTRKFYPILLELKGGTICFGKFLKIDENMNLLIKKAIFIPKNGFFFKEIPMIFIKGKIIKLIRIV